MNNLRSPCAIGIGKRRAGVQRSRGRLGVLILGSAYQRVQQAGDLLLPGGGCVKLAPHLGETVAHLGKPASTRDRSTDLLAASPQPEPLCAFRQSWPDGCILALRGRRQLLTACR